MFHFHAHTFRYNSLGIFPKTWLIILPAIWPRIWRAMGPPQNGQVDLKSKKVGVGSFDKVTVLLSYRCRLIEEV